MVEAGEPGRAHSESLYLEEQVEEFRMDFDLSEKTTLCGAAANASLPRSRIPETVNFVNGSSLGLIPFIRTEKKL
jgi:hypothetical protein